MTDELNPAAAIARVIDTELAALGATRQDVASVTIELSPDAFRLLFPNSRARFVQVDGVTFRKSA